MKSVNELTQQFIQHHHLDVSYNLACAVESYNEIVRYSDPILEESCAVKFSSSAKLLWIQVHNSCIAFQISILKYDIIRQLNKSLQLEVVKDLKIIQK